MKIRLAVAGLPEVQDLHDVLVGDHVDRARLVEEARHDVLIARQDGVQQLDGDLAADDGVLRQIYDTHPPLTEEALDAVIADGLID